MSPSPSHVEFQDVESEAARRRWIPQNIFHLSKAFKIPSYDRKKSFRGVTDRQQHYHGNRETESIDAADRVPSSVHTSRSHSTSSSTAATAASTVSTSPREDHYRHRYESLDFSTHEEIVAAFASGQRRLQSQMTERQRRTSVAQAAAERDAHLQLLEGSFGKRFLKNALKLVENYNEYGAEEKEKEAGAAAVAVKYEREKRSSSISAEIDQKQTKLASLRPVIAIYAKAWFPRQSEPLKSTAGRGHESPIGGFEDHTQLPPQAPSSSSIAAVLDTRPSDPSSFELPFTLGPHTTIEDLEIVEFDI